MDMINHNQSQIPCMSQHVWPFDLSLYHMQMFLKDYFTPAQIALSPLEHLSVAPT